MQLVVFQNGDSFGGSGLGGVLAALVINNGQGAVGGNSVISSSNGVNWKPVYSDSVSLLTQVIFDGTNFLAVGFRSILTSADGSSWLRQDVPSTTNLSKIVYGNGVYLAAGDYTDPAWPGAYRLMLRSTDRVHWSRAPDPGGFPISMARGNSVFVGVGYYGWVGTSSNGDTWANPVSGTSIELDSVKFINGLFIAGTATTSPDGISWTPTGTEVPKVFDVAYGDYGFVAVTANYWGPFLVNATNVLAWTKRPLAGSQLNSIVFANGTYIAVGDGGRIVKPVPLNAVASPLLSGYMSSQGFQLFATTQPGRSYRVQRSLDFSAWTDLFTFTNTQPVTPFVDASATNRSVGFYRIKSP